MILNALKTDSYGMTLPNIMRTDICMLGFPFVDRKTNSIVVGLGLDLTLPVANSCVCGIYYCCKSLRHQISISTKSTCDIKYDFMHRRGSKYAEKGPCISLVAVNRNSFVQ